MTGCYFASWGCGRLSGLGWGVGEGLGGWAGPELRGGPRMVGVARAQGRAFQEGRVIRAAGTSRLGIWLSLLSFPDIIQEIIREPSRESRLLFPDWSIPSLIQAPCPLHWGIFLSIF